MEQDIGIINSQSKGIYQYVKYFKRLKISGYKIFYIYHVIILFGLIYTASLITTYL